MLLRQQSAAQYVRMSTDMQQHSIDNQSEAIALYAASRGLTIVKSYEDAGKSGLRLDGRNALQQLLEDVQSGHANFQTIIVYDVSRWGRFQDSDESAHYEYLCKQSGVKIEYCAEQFDNDGSLTATILKNIKRAMAGEFSRELSVKVFAGQSSSVSKGFFVGSKPGFGLRRCLVDVYGNRKTVMAFGQRKSLSTDRTILVPGPVSEVQTVLEVYGLFVEEKLSLREIARHLNSRHVVNAEGRVWTPVAIRELLSNEKYMGASVFNRTSKKLNTRFKRNNPKKWVRAVLAFEPIVSVERFKKAQQQLVANARGYTENEILDWMTAIWCRDGQLSAGLIETSIESPRVNAISKHFGSLVAAYRRIGYPVNFSPGKSAAIRSMVITELANSLKEQGNHISYEFGSSCLLVDRELKIAVVSSSTQPNCGRNQWLIGGQAASKPDILVVARVNKRSSAIEEYLLIPVLFLTTGMWLTVTNARLKRLQAFRFKTLAPIYKMCLRERLM